MPSVSLKSTSQDLKATDTSTQCQHTSYNQEQYPCHLGQDNADQSTSVYQTEINFNDDINGVRKGCQVAEFYEPFRKKSERHEEPGQEPGEDECQTANSERVWCPECGQVYQETPGEAGQPAEYQYYNKCCPLVDGLRI